VTIERIVLYVKVRLPPAGGRIDPIIERQRRDLQDDSSRRAGGL
jgi:hypothetical protein